MSKIERIAVLGLAIVVALLTSGCSLSGPSAPWEDGHVQISADAQGMKAFGDTLNGLITNGKASPDKETAAWSTRRLEETEETRRAYRPGVLEGLFAKPQTVASGS